jgi:hypothetical protein
MGKADADTIATTVSGSPKKCDHEIVGRKTGLCVQCGYLVFQSARLAEVDPKITPSAPAAETAETSSEPARSGCQHEFGSGFCVRCGFKKPIAPTAPTSSCSNLQIKYALYCKKCDSTCLTKHCGECGSQTISTPTFDSPTVSVCDMMAFLCTCALRIPGRIVMLASGHVAIILLMIGFDLVPCQMLSRDTPDPFITNPRDYRDVSARSIWISFCALSLSCALAMSIGTGYEKIRDHGDYLSACPIAWRFFCTMVFVIEACLHTYLARYFKYRR